MKTQEKQIKEVFPEYTASKAITEGKILKINLFKKSNKLELTIKTKIYIPLKEIYEFENYLKTRFQIETVEIDMKYEENVVLPKIEEQWKEIVKYMEVKYPITKMLLKNAKLEIDNHKLTIVLTSKGAEILIKRGFETIIENLIYHIREEKYKVEYIEKIDEESVKRYEKNAKLAEKLAIELAQQEAQAALDADAGVAIARPSKDKGTNVGADESHHPIENGKKNVGAGLDLPKDKNNANNVGARRAVPNTR